MNPPPASPPAIRFEDRRRRYRPRGVALLAVAGLLAAAVPTSLLATASTSHPSARAEQPVSGRVAIAGSTAGITAAVAIGRIVRRAADADGTNLPRRLAKDPALRRTLQALRSGKAAAGTPAASIVVGGSVADIPAVAVAAYQRATYFANGSNPGCNISWTLVAAIGRVESNHGRFGGSTPGQGGEVRPFVLGPVLDGSGGNAAISDTDSGRYDDDTRWDRAVGPMQFIPSTWAIDGRDANGDGVRDPENIFDAALAAADYLCASGGDLSTPAAAERAVLSYNHSLDYVLVVLGYSDAYGGQNLSPVAADIARYLAALSKAQKAAHKKPAKKAAKKVHRPITRRATPMPSVKPTAKPVPSHSPKPTSKPTPAPSPTSSPTAAPTAPPSTALSAAPPSPSAATGQA